MISSTLSQSIKTLKTILEKIENKSRRQDFFREPCERPFVRNLAIAHNAVHPDKYTGKFLSNKFMLTAD